MKYKVFISQPMMNKTARELKEERDSLARKLEKQGYDIIDTILDLGKDATSLQYLAKSIELMNEADLVLFMPNWEKARGCIIEHEIALRYGKYVKEIERQ